MAELNDDVARAVTEAHEQEWTIIIATLIRMTGDWELAEDATQEAFGRAVERWSRDGIPRNPGAWLTTVAKNVVRDRWRRVATEASGVREFAMYEEQTNGQTMGTQDETDDRLRLVFTCAHPALALDARVALTLRTVGGLSTAEIARAFLTSEQTIAKRLVRARGKMRNAGIPYRVPDPEELPDRLSAVLSVLYLIFNEGYASTAGDGLVRLDLTDEAIRLCRMLVDLMPREAEPSGLLALMLFQRSRTAARVDDRGELVSLEDQDRGLWDYELIRDGSRLLRRAEALDRPGDYTIQAAIASCHATAPDAASVNADRLVVLYDRLLERTGSPVVALNRVVALVMRDGPEAGLRALANPELETALRDYYLYPATRADLLRRIGRTSEAASAYREAEALAPNPVERAYLKRRRTLL